jgi:uncharacterized membrane protein YphA (DoxX/SURF4 family)
MNSSFYTQKIGRYLTEEVSIAPLVTFRIAFGFLMIFSTVRFLVLGWVKDHYLDTVFQFKYFGFEWVQVLPPFWMYAIHVLMILAALGVMLGFFYRISALLLFLTFTYTELIDLTYYLNHYYFVSIVSMLMIFLPANRYFSLDVLRKPAIYTEKISRWPITVIRLQLAIVYTYAGLAKINYDWLILALPLKIWVPANDQLPLVGPIMKWKITPYLFSWIGMIYDCTITLFLYMKRTRLLAYLSVVIFHTLTGMMFQIGVFPLVMIAATLIFFSDEWHIRLIKGMRTFIRKFIPFNEPEVTVEVAGKGNFAPRKMLAVFLVTHFVFQILFPWRYLLYPGNLFWTEEGYRFSWRVMLMEKAGTATFYVRDGENGKEGVVINSEFLNPHQEKQMAMQPDMILQYAHFLADHYRKEGIADPHVRAEVYVTLNARPSKLLIDPQVNLAAIKDSFAPKKWILHYES